MTELFVLTGKGGVGKSTCSSATAIHHALKGQRVLLASSDPAHNLSDLFHQKFGGVPQAVNGLPNLFVLELDAVNESKQYMEQLSNAINEQMKKGLGLGMDLMGDMTIPGMDEAIAMMQLRKHVSSGEWDVVIFDTAPTGHTLRALTIPDVLDGWLLRAVAWKKKLKALKSILFRAQKDNFEELIHNLRTELAELREVLRAPTSHIILVGIAEDLAVMETARTISFLSRLGMSAEGVIINRIIPDFGEEWESENTVVKMVHQQFLNQQQSLTLAAKHFGQLNVKRVPLVAYAPVGIANMTEFAKLLWG